MIPDDPDDRKNLEDLIAREIAARWYVTTPRKAWGVVTHEPAVLKLREIASAVLRLVEDHEPGEDVKTDEEFTRRTRKRVEIAPELPLGDVPT